MHHTRRAMIAGLAAAPLLPSLVRAAEAGVPPPDLERRVAVKGGSLYVRVNGDLASGKPPLLLVHGGPGGALWQFFPALPLASDRAIILYDQLDSGRSDAPGDPANWTVERYVSEIDAVRMALGVEDLHLLGHSWGGILATRYAAALPKGLHSLILQGTPLSAASAKADIERLLDALPDGAGATIRKHEAAGTLEDPAYGEAMMLFVRKHLNRTSVRALAMPYMEATPPDRGDALAMAITGGSLTQGFGGVLKGFDDTPLLPRITAPTLVLDGEFDIVTPATAKAHAAALKRGTFEELKGAGHMAQFDQPDAWRTSVQRFIAARDV